MVCWLIDSWDHMVRAFPLLPLLPLTVGHFVFPAALVCTGIFIGLLFTRFWFISVVYAIWWYFDRDTPRKGGRSSVYMKKGRIWKYMRDYFPVKVSV